MNTVELGPNFANAHATAIYHKEGVYTPERLAKKLMKNAKLLESLEMPEDDAAEIRDVLVIEFKPSVQEFLKACKNGDVTKVMSMLERRASVNCSDQVSHCRILPILTHDITVEDTDWLYMGQGIACVYRLSFSCV